MKHANAGQFILAASATLAAAGLSWAGYKAVAPKVSLPKGGPAPGAGSSPNNPLPHPGNGAVDARIPKVAERIKRLWKEAMGDDEEAMPAALELIFSQMYGETGVAEPGGGGWWEDRSDPNGKWAKAHPDLPLQGDMRGSGNLGGVQCQKCSDSGPGYTCVPYGDTHPLPDGTSKFYPVCFKYYRDGDGRSAGDWAALDYLRTVKRVLKNDLSPLKSGNLQTYATALRKGGYYEGFGKTQEDRIKHYEQMMLCHLPAVALALGHDRIHTDIRQQLIDEPNPGCPKKKVAGIEGAGTVAAIAASAVAATGAIAWGVSKSIEASAAKDDMARHMAEMKAAEAAKPPPAPVVIAPPPAPSQAAQTTKAITDTVMAIAKLAKGAEPPRPMYDVRGTEVGSTAGTVAVVAASAGTLAAAAYAAKAVADAAKDAPAKVASALNPLATVEAPKNPSAEHGPKGEPIKGRERDIAPNVDPVPTEPGVPEDKSIFEKAYDMSPLAAIRRAIGGAEQLQALHLAGALPRARMVPVTGELIWYIEKPSAAAPNPPSDKPVGEAAPVDGCCGSAETDDKPSDGPGEPIHLPEAEVGAVQDDVFSMVDAAATAFSNAWMPGSGDAISAVVRTGKGAIDRGTGHDPGKAVIAPSLAQQAKQQEAEINASVAAGLERQAKAQEALALQKAAAETAEATKALACAPAKRVVREWVARHPILTRALSPDMRAAAVDPCADDGASVKAFVAANPFTVAHTSPDLRAITGVHAEMKSLPLVKVRRDGTGRMKKAAEVSVGQSSEPQASGLMIKAIREGRQAPVQWAPIMLDDDIEVEVMGDAMKADVDGQLLRLPVSYAETITAAQLLGKGTLIPFSKRIADAVYRQSAKLVYNGLVSTKEDSNHMRSLAFVQKFNDDINAQIAKKGADGTLIFGPWKLWILSNKLGVMARDNKSEPAAINYGGWNAKGATVQTEGTWHGYGHDDYSQLLQFAKRWGTRKSTGGRVDLLAWIEQNEGVGGQFTEPFRG